MKKIIFYGLGGAGQRHLRIINKLRFRKKLFAYRLLKKVNSLTAKFRLLKTPLEQKYKNLFIIDNLNNSFKKKINDAWISNCSNQHYYYTKQNLLVSRNVFVEKPFLCSKKEFLLIKNLIQSKKLKFLVGYQRRFHRLVIKLKNLLDCEKHSIRKVIINVNSDVTQWHKYENFRNLYACKKSLGGGSILTECHEIDLALFYFGMPKKIYCKKFFNNKKKLDVETKHKITMYYDKFKVFFNINMLAKKQKRSIEVLSKYKSYLLDLESNLLKIEDQKLNKITKFSISNNENIMQFKKQANYFYSKKFNFQNSLKQAEENMIILNSLIKSSQKKMIVNILNH